MSVRKIINLISYKSIFQASIMIIHKLDKLYLNI